MNDAMTGVGREEEPAPRGKGRTTRGLRAGVALAVLAGLSAWAASWVWGATTHGLGGGDASSYLGMANDIRAGLLPTTPFLEIWDRFAPQAFYDAGGHVASTHFPPLYPYLLALVSGLTRNTSSAARLLNVVLLPLNLALLAWLTARMVGYKSWLATVAPVVVVLLVPDTAGEGFGSAGFLENFTAVGSEALFCALFVGALIALIAYVQRPRRLTLGIVAALAAAAYATRYVGVALIVVIALTLVLIDRRAPIRRRILRAVVVSGVSAAPVIMFLTWGASRGQRQGAIVNTRFDPGLGHLGDVFGSYVIGRVGSHDLRVAAIIVVLALLAAATIFLVLRPRGTRAPDSSAICAMSIVALGIVTYVMVVEASQALLNATVPIDGRILMPIRGPMTALIVAAIFSVLSSVVSRQLLLVVLTALLLLVVAVGWRTQQAFLDRPRFSAHVTDAERPLLRRDPRDLVATNFPASVYRATGQHVVTLPSRTTYVTLRPNPSFHREAGRLAQLLRRRGGCVLWLPSYISIAYLSPTELSRLVPLRLVRGSTATGALYTTEWAEWPKSIRCHH